MSEPKRVTFETISTSTSKNLAPDALEKNEKAIRLELKLFEPDNNKFPAFNYKKLLRAEKEKQKIPLPNGFVDPMEEIDHDARKLAQEFERKYGNTYGGSDTRLTKDRPITDKGSGYDENNGFIDDSEACDEVIPDEMDTDRGGFYINCGPLSYKAQKASSMSSGDDESSNLSEASVTLENGNTNKKQKLHDKNKVKEKKIDEIKPKEKPAIIVSETTKEISNKEVKTTTVKDMLRAQRDANILKTSSHIKRSKSTSSATSDDSSSSDSDSSESSSDADPSRHSDDDEFESVENKATDCKPIDNIATSNNKIQINGTTTSDNIPQEADVKFLENLNTSTRDQITRLSDFSKDLKDNLFQSDQALDLLYEIMKAHQSDSKLQSQIYSHLEIVLPYSKQRLQKEVKEYAIKKCENEVRTLERKLQKEISEMMVDVCERYEIDLKKQKANYQGSDKPEHQFRNPRRKFPWNENLRLKVNELIMKWQSLYDQRQHRDQTLEQYTTAYITDKLLPIWPNGWMRANDIQSNFMPKTKEKDAKKSTNEHKISSKPQPPQIYLPPIIVDNIKESAIMVHPVEKKKSHTIKDSVKMVKSSDDKPTLPKTDKKHLHSTSDRPTASSLLTMSLGDTFTSKPAPIKTIPVEPLLTGSGTSISIKPKSITTASSSSTSSNGDATLYGRHPENNVSNVSIEYLSPTKRASDHSISQLISYSPSNHSTIASNLMHSTQSTLVQSSYANDSPTTSSHAVAIKNTVGTSLKAKTIDSHHRPQTSSNGSNNNNFLHNNNNSSSSNNSKRLSSAIIDLSCDTDDGEVSTKRPKHNKHKHNKKSKESVSNSVQLPNSVTVQSMLNQMHQAQSLNMNASASDEVDHNQIIHDLKELSASNSTRKSFDSILENQSEYKQHYNHYRVSSPPYDRKQDHFF